MFENIIADMAIFLATLILFQSLPFCPILIRLKNSPLMDLEIQRKLRGVKFVTLEEWLSLFVKQDASVFRSLFLAKLGRFRYSESAVLGVYTLSNVAPL